MDHGRTAQLTLTLGGHLGQDVTLMRALALVAAGGFLNRLEAPL